ncbi:unnamed protein product [Paramecium octaurelia]|uniref:Uncharacterized protein n=1 Tax=Paramecium octaurelia TaxID=43137 RepID=A0A8S1TZQ7_PAROT|nr:unnamed protein product [Paramecium octaurelia]
MELIYIKFSLRSRIEKQQICKGFQNLSRDSYPFIHNKEQQGSRKTKELFIVIHHSHLLLLLSFILLIQQKIDEEFQAPLTDYFLLVYPINLANFLGSSLDLDDLCEFKILNVQECGVRKELKTLFAHSSDTFRRWAQIPFWVRAEGENRNQENSKRSEDNISIRTKKHRLRLVKKHLRPNLSQRLDNLDIKSNYRQQLSPHKRIIGDKKRIGKGHYSPLQSFSNTASSMRSISKIVLNLFISIITIYSQQLLTFFCFIFLISPYFHQLINNFPCIDIQFLYILFLLPIL